MESPLYQVHKECFDKHMEEYNSLVSENRELKVTLHHANSTIEALRKSLMMGGAGYGD
jgi:predicted helicase